MKISVKAQKELISEKANKLLAESRLSPGSINLQFGQLLGLQTAVTYVFGEGPLLAEIRRLLIEMIKPATPPEGANV